MFLNWIFGGLAGVSLGLTGWQWLAARRFPLHQRNLDPRFAPALTLLKPLKGCDAETRRCLQSWFAQSYPGPVQILLGVADAEDPVCAVARELIAAHPHCDARLVICPDSLGANAKVSTLVQLETHVKHELILVSDADVRVPPDFLSTLVTPLADSKVGAAFCFYRLANPSNLAMRWEAVATNADFWSQVLMGNSLKPVDFILGAVMLTRQEQLKEIGGWTALVDYLADDYQLGHRIAQRGHRIAICPLVVECWDAPMSWRQVWAHQLRWARTIRVCQPLPYFCSISSNATLWPLLWCAVAPSAFTLVVACGCWSFRMFAAVALQTRLTQTRGHGFDDWLVPVKDLLQVAVWALAFLGNHLEWRGQRYHVLAGGKLVKD